MSEANPNNSAVDFVLEFASLIRNLLKDLYT